MNDYTRNLISTICYNGRRRDLEFYAKQLLMADKTAKDASFREKMLTLLDKKQETIEVPANCGLFLIAEKEANINLDRYYLSEREKQVFDKLAIQQKVSDILLEKNIPTKNTLLLYGESGTGKTAFGRYIARQLNLPFLYMNFSYLIDSLLGKTQQNLTNAFRFAKSMDCVFMLDEIDAIATQRGLGNDVSEIGRITISLMQELDTIIGKTIIVAATNRIDVIDEAVLNRLSNKHQVLRFNEDERKAFVLKYLQDVQDDIAISTEEIMNLYQIDVSQRLLERNIIDFIADKYYKKIEREGE